MWISKHNFVADKANFFTQDAAKFAKKHLYMLVKTGSYCISENDSTNPLSFSQ